MSSPSKRPRGQAPNDDPPEDAPVVESGNPHVDQDTELPVIEAEDSEDTQSLTDMFGPENDGRVQLRIYRLTPQTLNGERIRGYCGVVPYGEDIEWIAENKGGGTFRIQKYANRKYAESRTIFISGPPRVSPPFAGSTVAPLSKPADPGINRQPQDDDSFWRNLRQTMVTEAMLASVRPASMSDQIVLALLNKNQEPADKADPMETMLNTLDAIDRIRDRIGSAGDGAPSGNGWLDLLNKGLDVIPKIAAASARRPQLTRPAPAQLPAPVLAEPAAKPQPTPQEQAEMSVFQIAQNCIGTTVQAFLEEPPFTPDETVATLKTIIPMTAELGQSLQANKAALYKGAVLALHQAIEPDPEEDEKFRLFFEDVWAKLTANT